MSDTLFPPTHWSAVLEAAGAEPDKARRGFERLCGEYRDAIDHWMRLQRLSQEDAEDATHDFLEQWLRRDNPLQGFQRGERRFREFLRVCLRNFFVGWHERRRAARRGDGAEHIPWEHDDLIPDGADAHAALDFAFATQIHADVIASLKPKWQSRLRDGRFDRLHAVALGAAVHPGSAALATDLHAPVNTVNSWVLRFREDYYAAFRQAVERQTEPEFIDDEVIHLHQLLLHPPPG